jgi:hypothetical protein
MQGVVDVAMSAEREALAMKQLAGMGKQRITPPQPTPKPAPKPNTQALERQQARLAKVATATRESRHRAALLGCTHIMHIGGGDKQFERLWCTTCGGWQAVASIRR